jgi:hypothetical protein
VCECKDWARPVGFSTIAKFGRVLDSTKSKFGILFSKKGITGVKRTFAARLEQIQLFHDHGIAIVVVSMEDLRKVAAGANFISVLRTKYEAVRFDVRRIVG